MERGTLGDSSTSAGCADRGDPAVPDHPSRVGQVPAALNEHESRVLPGEHSVIDDDLLKCTPYIVNSQYWVLICTDCRHCVNPGRALKHIHKHHSHCKVRTDFVSQLKEKFPRLVSDEIHPSGVVEPIFGLAIPPEPYTICARCHRGYTNVGTWRRHACGKADEDLEGELEHFSSLVQTFFRGPKVCYFPVKLPAMVAREPRGDDFDLFMSGYQDLVLSEDGAGTPQDYRELNQFLLKEGWIEHLSGHSLSELSILTDLPGEGEILKPVGREVVSLMSNIQEVIGVAGHHVRRLLGRRPA